MTQPVCTCSRFKRNEDCPLHCRPRCTVEHDGPQPEGTWLLPGVEEDPPQWVCEACGKALAAQGNPVQIGMLR